MWHQGTGDVGVAAGDAEIIGAGGMLGEECQAILMTVWESSGG